MPQVNCKNCNKEFYAKPSWLEHGWGIYCSQTCNHQSQKNGKLYTCTTCGEAVYRSIKYQLRSKSGKFFCSKSCQAVWRNIVFSGEGHPNWKSGESVYRGILKRAKVPQSCAKCHSQDTRILAVHHKDKNRQNNTVANLVWLCHNCHHLVHHYVDESRGFLSARS